MTDEIELSKMAGPGLAAGEKLDRAKNRSARLKPADFKEDSKFLDTAPPAEPAPAPLQDESLYEAVRVPRGPRSF